jgi:uncharacterized protein YjbI with pentapeptide repeats
MKLDMKKWDKQIDKTFEDYGNFESIDFRGFNFRDRGLKKKTFINCILDDCDLSKTFMNATQFWGCDLKNVNFGNNIVIRKVKELGEEVIINP